VEVETASAKTFTIYLDNLWIQYRDDQDDRVGILERHLAAMAEMIEPVEQSTTRDNIVPTVKEIEYMNLLREDTAREYLVADMWIVYATDLPNSIRTVRTAELQALNIGPSELRGLAERNLRRILPAVERHGGDPYYLLTAGGHYTASLLLCDEVWEEVQELVEGDLVAVVPSRDVLLFTGTGSREGVQAVRQKAREIHEGGDHIISQTLLRRVSGRWRAFE
jgi:uncharacterized protein YtpQ (UPF0354 family)